MASWRDPGSECRCIKASGIKELPSCGEGAESIAVPGPEAPQCVVCIRGLPKLGDILMGVPFEGLLCYVGYKGGTPIGEILT